VLISCCLLCRPLFKLVNRKSIDPYQGFTKKRQKHILTFKFVTSNRITIGQRPSGLAQDEHLILHEIIDIEHGILFSGFLSLSSNLRDMLVRDILNLRGN